MTVILIVEDDFFIRQMAEVMVQDCGHETMSACDVNEALAILRAPGHIDAMFTDIYLKKDMLGGCDLAIQAMEIRPDLRVLYTTGNTITEKMKGLFCVGASFLPKPYTQLQLQTSVDGLLAA